MQMERDYIKNLILEHLENYPNSVITSRTLFVRNNIEKIKELTNFLNEDCKVTERLYVILHDYTKEDVKCPLCQNNKNFNTVNKGYWLTCSQSCSTSYTNLNRDKSVYAKMGNTIKNRTPEQRKKVFEKKHKTSISRYGENYQSKFSRKAYETAVERGTFKSGFKLIQENDPEKWEEMHKKAALTMLNDIDENGNNHYDRVHIKKLNDIDEDGNNFYERQYIKNLIPDESGLNLFQRIRKTHFERGTWIPPDKKEKFEGYKHLVWYYTRKQPLTKLENFDKRGRTENGGYHLDHKFSILEGFNQGICPKIIGDISNLRMIPGKDNTSKGSRSDISLDMLLYKIEKYK